LPVTLEGDGHFFTFLAPWQGWQGSIIQPEIKKTMGKQTLMLH
jgi:hypothetical protein